MMHTTSATAAAFLVAAGAFVTLGSLPAAAADEDDAVLHFADMNGVRDWRPDPAADDEAILIQGRNGDWFRATFSAPCPELKFAHAVAFVTDTLGNLDRFTSIIVGGERCHFRTFERTGDPDERRGRIDTEIPNER
jgi:hypothetical protein